MRPISTELTPVETASMSSRRLKPEKMRALIVSFIVDDSLISPSRRDRRCVGTALVVAARESRPRAPRSSGISPRVKVELSDDRYYLWYYRRARCLARHGDTAGLRKTAAPLECARAAGRPPGSAVHLIDYSTVRGLV